MASKIVFLTLALLSFCKVQSQSIGCLPNYQPSSPSKGQSSCNGCGKSLPQTLQFQPNNNGVKASPQLQIVPGQNFNLQAIPLSQLLSQSQESNLPRGQTGFNAPKQNIQVTSIPQVPSSCAQCTQSQPCNSNPSVITAPVSTITIPPTTCTTIIDNSLSNCLANALQMMIANDFINSAISNNIINQDCISIPAVETSVPSFDLSSFVKNLNANQLQQYQSSGTSAATLPCSQPDDGVQGYDWRQLLERYQDNQCSQPQPKNLDWMTVLNYLSSQNKEPEPEYDYRSFINSLKQKYKTVDDCDQGYDWRQLLERFQDNQCSQNNQCSQPQPKNINWSAILNYLNSQNKEPEPEYDYSSFINSLKKGKTAGQTTQQYPQEFNYNVQQNCQSSQGDINSGVIDAIRAYIGKSSDKSYGNVAEVMFPEEIPAQLVCNYGYMPTTVPVVSFSVAPLGDPNSNFIVGSPTC